MSTANFRPAACAFSAGVKGAVIGNGRALLGWFRDVRYDPPDWPLKPLPGQTMTADVSDDCWHVEFFAPVTMKSVGESQLGVYDQGVRTVLPAFQGAIAVRLTRLEP